MIVVERATTSLKGQPNKKAPTFLRVSAFGLANQIIKALEAGLESVTTEPQQPLIISQIDIKTKKP